MTPLFPLIQPVLPHHLISRVVGAAANSTWPPLKRLLINQVSQHYDIRLDDYVIKDKEQFESFNAFFTRELDPEARPLDVRPEGVACPVDGTVSQLGTINDDVIFQAKGKYYSAAALLGDDTKARDYAHGHFATLYLAPNNYHRIHMPLDAKLKSMLYVPGRLFSVNTQSAEHIDRVFARNERVVAHFTTARGPLAMVLVGALNVGSIETVHQGIIAPSALSKTTRWDYARGQQLAFRKGEEFGRFNLGSTVILLAGKDMLEWSSELDAGSALEMGMPIGDLSGTNDSS
ncbi:MAG: archaetidylserine decarboxylase [Gammaproteobacteria bacterium]